MRSLACLVVAALLCVASISEARAQTIAYGIAFDEVFRVNLDTRRATLVGATGSYAGRTIGQLSGLTYSPQGELFAASGTLGALVKINPGNGAATFIGSFGLSGQGSGQFETLDLSMTYGCDGQLWMTSAINANLWRVNPQTGATTLVGNTGRLLSGLAIRNARLYATGIGSDQALYTIDTATAQATPIGGLGLSAPWVEPDFGADGTLWATLSYNPPQNREWSDLARIDVNTGMATNLGPITGPESLRFFSMRGLAVAANSCQPLPGGGTPVVAATLPVQSPWALLLLALGVIVLGATHARRGAR
ncbi:MAG: hypothetical protein ABI650_05150 [Dokdonella sp.]